MKKLLALFISIMMLASLSVTAVFADTAEKEPTSNWLPQNYVLDGYEIPTVMSYNAEEGSVSFKGGLNAGIATTGFSYAKPIDVENFSIDMTLDIPDIDKLTWICFSFLDVLTAYDNGNPVPVNQPFNCFSGRNHYANNVQTGSVMQFWTDRLLTDNVIKITYNEKNLDNITGEKTTNGWNEITNGNFVGAVKLNNTYDGKFSLSLTAKEDGVAFNAFGGEWLGESAETENVFDQQLDCFNAGNTLAGFRNYFKTNDCYFSMLLMYSDGQHRNVELKVNKVNGKLASDGTAPDYLNDKTVEADGVKLTVKNSTVGNFGVYAGQVNGVKKTVYDNTDDDYAAVTARATKVGMEVVDFFSVAPTVDDKAIYLSGYVDGEYTLSSDYDEYKFYYINEDGDAEELSSSYAAAENGVLKFKVDNSSISKIAVLGKKAEQKSGCGAGINGGLFALLALAAIVPVTLSLKKKEN